ncbi:hypothetical protein [Tuwongella immobilis]|uniref:Uncharacterized protein n=1 Tax=Tuwongella immobilis TaxID=692036 RepID=A0A6C2YP52_9BACT|nr:hypothetical protein [Tuwongella immobilis]VIP03216.1 Uncharacterized protein OS=Planctomyces brasiliensis (strain ATCC 49424 / DSM 5305 / JCM 21570 / NBRC 103401 / IFAM 1448) GN=Plabr_4632 PE=4 SV=1 [Tuwongella immobilis]VTS03736.1 Uncharacterized protein OS=Planctomyces brasiliensis (strain ATCC 49424 / DSM 5305 / JCM 21570 / NBRC 103401 / IFAM 1448) GN=Plabr_4632 PE=4 SV=1 [Tuwongella immobilis]
MLTLLAVDSWVSETIMRVLMLVLTTAASFVIGRWWGRRNAVQQWATKQFLSRLNVSLNLLEDNTLKIRTLLERDLQDIFHNQIKIEKLQDAIAKVTVENPILPIEPKDRWYLLNDVLNVVAEHFVTGLIKQDGNVPVTKVRYVLFLTCEVVGDERVRKVRALMLRKDLMLDFPYMATIPQLEREWHDARIYTLRKAVQVYQQQPDLFIELELSV